MNIKFRCYLVISMVLTVLLGSCSRGSDATSGASWAPEAEPLQMAVQGMTVTRSLLVNEIRGAGITEGIRESWVISETEGVIQDLWFSLGERVGEGQELVRVDDDLAARNRDLANQQYETALLEFQASERSRESGSISQLQYSQITDRLLAADASRAAALDSFDNTVMKAPFSGAVASMDRNLGIGNFLARGTRVARIIDDSAFRTEISVGEGQVLLIDEGAEALITGNDGVKRYGKISAVSAGSEVSTGSYTVVVEWVPEDGDRLRSGMSVEVSIAVDREEAQVIIPASAIRVRGGLNYVFVDNDGYAEFRELTLGSRLGDRVEVYQGLEVGQVILTSGMASLTPGIEVDVTIVAESGDA